MPQRIFQSGVATIIAIGLKCINFFLNYSFYFLLNHGESLSSHANISCGMKLLRIFRIVLLKMLTFSLTLVFEKALVQLNSLIALRISSILAFSWCQTSRNTEECM